MQTPAGGGAVESFQKVSARDGSELGENLFSGIEFLGQCVQPRLPLPDGSANKIRRHILHHQRADEFRSGCGQTP